MSPLLSLNQLRLKLENKTGAVFPAFPPKKKKKDYDDTTIRIELTWCLNHVSASCSTSETMASSSAKDKQIRYIQKVHPTGAILYSVINQVFYSV